MHMTSLLGPRDKVMVMVGLLVRYGFRMYRTPVPIVGDVPAIRPSKAERQLRKKPPLDADADAVPVTPPA